MPERHQTARERAGSGAWSLVVDDRRRLRPSRAEVAEADDIVSTKRQRTGKFLDTSRISEGTDGGGAAENLEHLAGDCAGFGEGDRAAVGVTASAVDERASRRE